MGVVNQLGMHLAANNKITQLQLVFFFFFNKDLHFSFRKFWSMMLLVLEY